MRWRRILHIAWRDLRLVHAGKSWWRLPAIALFLLLPAGALPLPSSPTADLARAGGEIPAALDDQIEFRPRSPIQLSGEDPVVLRGSRVSVPLRAALDGLGGVGVTILRRGEERRMPGRSLLVALLAISLLTGPLAESLPGERQRGTLETLLTAGVSRAELITGKWLAWTLATTAMTAIVAATGMLDGSQEVGIWPLALPPVAGVAVAFGLWLGRGAADEIAGATRTMRVLPVTAVTLLVAAYALGTVHPALGALVPLGGALLVAGDVFVGALPLATAWAGSVAAVVGLLAWTARDLTEVGLRRERIGDSAGLVAMAALLWWLPVVGPVAWTAAGNAALADSLPIHPGVALGGVALALVAGIEWVRGPMAPLRWSRAGLLAGVAAGAALAVTDLVSLAIPLAETDWVVAAGDRLAEGLAPGLPLVAVAVALGHELFFRGLLQRRIGLVATVVCWTVVMSPFDPVRGIVSGVALGLLARRSLLAAVAAHLVWAVAPW